MRLEGPTVSDSRVVLQTAIDRKSLVTNEIPLSQERFGSNVRRIFVSRLWRELNSGNLADYLSSLNRLKGLDENNKIGVIILVNDNQSDGNSILEENRKTMQYLSALSKVI